MKLHELRESRATKVAEMRNLVDANKTMTADQQAAFDRLKSEVVDLEGQESRALFLDAAERRSGGLPVDKQAAKLEGDFSVLRVLQAQVEGRSVDGLEREYSQEAERRTGRKAQGAFIPMTALEKRANTTTTAADIVPTVHRPDLYIGPLRESLVARSLGVRVLPGLTGNLSVPKYGTGLATGWVAEGGAVPDGDMTFGSVGLEPKHVGGKTEMSRQLIQQSSPAIEQLIRDDLAFLIAKQIDTAIIAGTGATNQPLGVLNMTGVQSGLLATLNWPAVLAFAQKLEDAEVFGGTWLTNAAVKNKFAATLKEAGLPGYLLEAGRVAERAMVTSKAVPANTVVLGDFSQILLGVWSELDILVNPFAEPAYSRGGVVVRAMATVGTACRHEQAFVIADDLT